MINIHDGQITDLLSNPLRHNPETIATAYAVLQGKRRILALVERTRLMSAVDVLEERILDYLAVELRTPAYEDSLPIETKRTLIKGTLPFYSKLGTPAAVEWVINAVFGTGGIEEWFEYGGQPHHFRVHITMRNDVMPLDRFEQLVRSIQLVKRLSSWLDEIIFTFIIPPATVRVGGSVGAQTWIQVPAEPDKYSFQDTVHIGGGVGAAASIAIPQGPDSYHFQSAIHTGGIATAQAAITVPGDTSPPLPATTILRTGGVCTIISNIQPKGE